MCVCVCIYVYKISVCVQGPFKLSITAAKVTVDAADERSGVCEWQSQHMRMYSYGTACLQYVCVWLGSLW